MYRWRDLVMVTAVLTVALVASSCTWGQGNNNPITNGSFEQVDAQGQPVGWQILGNGQVETGEAHTGKRALHLVRTPGTQTETGLNRAWEPSTGHQGAMLSQLKGGVRFWYKAVAADPAGSLTIQVIPMNDKPLEWPGGRVIWSVPSAYVGDGQWHQGAVAYDFTKDSGAKWVQVGARLTGNSGDLWLDDFKWVAEVGPVLQINSLSFAETTGREGEQGTLTMELSNVGDQPVPAGKATVELPAGLSTKAATASFAAMAPGKKDELTWTVTGRRDAPSYHLAVSAKAGGQTASSSLVLKPEIEVKRLECPRLILKRGEPVTVKLIAKNTGGAIASAEKAYLTAPHGFKVREVPVRGGLRPSIEGPVAEWQVTPDDFTPLSNLCAGLQGSEGQESTPVVVPEHMPRSVSTSGDVYAFQRDNQVVIGSGRTRLIIARESEGYGVAALQARDGGNWRTVAYLPRMGLVATKDGEKVLAADHVTAGPTPHGASAVLEGTTELGGVSWKVRWDLTVSRHADTIGYSMTATPSSKAEITALEGPMIYAGEGSSTVRDDAILPGLEWLVRGEESSSALDIMPDHVDRIRYVPHPYKVTIPAVGVRYGDVTVGLLWDTPPTQPSAKQAGYESLVFASPDRFEGHPSSLMGLFLPGVGHGLEENHRRATTPLPVAAGEALTVRAELLASPAAKDSLVAIDQWFDQHGYPRPLANPRGTDDQEIAFSLRGYFKDHALWNPKWNKWYSDLIKGFAPTLGPASELLWGADLLKTGKVADQSRALAAEALGADAAALKTYTHYRPTPSSILQARRAVRDLIASQNPDGTWRFGGDKAGPWPAKGVNYKYLGPVGATAVGLTANKATQVLSYALLTGDPAATAAGLKALRAMRKFRVPRAAQVWEVPVHTPDILASAQATDAYLAGYKLTGDRQWLDDAIYWARSGLPFVYVWAAPKEPEMQGASIPVFGATGYVLSWFGVAVQWNGLAYSNAILSLSQYDKGFPWRRVADNLLRSAMYLQATSGDRLAEWPDARNLIPGRPGAHGSTPVCFQPSSILQELWRFMGVSPGQKVVAVRQGDQHLALRGVGTFGYNTWRGDVLRFTVTYRPPQLGAVEVIGTAKPSEVLLDGKPLPEATDLWAGTGPAWHWSADAVDLVVRITTEGTHRVEVRGVKRVPFPPGPPVLRDIDFHFDRGLQSWTALNDLQPLAISGGFLTSTTTGTDPYMSREGLRVQGHAGDVLVVRMSATAGGDGGSIFWGTAAEPTLSPAREVDFKFTSDGRLQVVRVPVGEADQWAGHTITVLRIDPGGGTVGAKVRIKSVVLERGGK